MPSRELLGAMGPIALQLPIAFLLAFLFALYGTPKAAAAARRFGLVDQPDGHLKHHADPTPYLGGMAIFTAFLLAFAFVFDLSSPGVLGFLLAGSIVVTLGLIDDFGALTPVAKLVGQVIAVGVLIKCGVRIDLAALPYWGNVLLTLVWVIGIINAFNFLDIMDGLAAGTALIATVFLCLLALLSRQFDIAKLGFVLSGALLGFIRYNFAPAQIYLGDTGAMFLGLVVGALAMSVDHSLHNPVAVLNPALVLAVPCFEMVFTTGMRLVHRRNPMFGSKDHPAKRLELIGWPIPRIVLSAYAVGVVMGLLALWNRSLTWGQGWVLIGGVTGACLIGAGLLARIRVPH